MRILMPHDAFWAIDDLSDCRNILGKIPTKAANVTNKQIALDNCNQRIQKTFPNLSGVYPKISVSICYPGIAFSHHYQNLPQLHRNK